jgi:V-type H+-transporting ATPase subunit a
VFQEIVNTYGVPLYKEVNPAYFTCVTFPFLFGVMFGDIGHGTVLLFAGAFFCLLEPCLKGKSSTLNMILQIRYLLLLLGLFSTFTGFVYNDMMSIPLYLKDSCYDKITGKRLIQHEGNHTVDTCIYPFGVDPVWYTARNELQFLNSLKMKIAVILGILQMSLGVFMKGVNSIYFKNWTDFFHEFVP